MPAHGHSLPMHRFLYGAAQQFIADRESGKGERGYRLVGPCWSRWRIVTFPMRWFHATFRRLLCITLNVEGTSGRTVKQQLILEISRLCRYHCESDRDRRCSAAQHVPRQRFDAPARRGVARSRRRHSVRMRLDWLAWRLLGTARHGRPILRRIKVFVRSWEGSSARPARCVRSSHATH